MVGKDIPLKEKEGSLFQKWYLFDTQTGNKYEFEIAQEVAKFLNCGVSTVTSARQRKTMLKKRYKVIAVK